MSAMRGVCVWSACIVVGGAATVTGCDHSSPGPSAAAISEATTAPAPAPPAADVTISNVAYAVRAPVTPGQQVRVVNDDQANRGVTADANAAFDVSVSGGGSITTFTAPMTPGVYPFHCKYHPQMQGSLTVQIDDQ